MRLPTRAPRVPFVMVLAAVVAAVLAATGCAKATPGGVGQSTAPATSTGTGSTGGTPAPTTPAAEGTYKVTYGFAVPRTEITVTHSIKPPIAPPPAPPLPYLVGIYTGDHSNENPGYARISFYFRGAFPSYKFEYAAKVLSQGQGKPIPLEGNSFLNIVFVEAQTHDNSGASTIKDMANTHIGFHNLVSYGFAGDFEGYVGYGLGIQVAKNSDQILPIRVGELKKPDGAGGFLYVVAFDVRNG